MPFLSSVRGSFGARGRLRNFSGRGDGSSAALAGTSAIQIKQETGTNANGYYFINLGNGQGAQQVYCIMDSAVDGGGWMVLWGNPAGGTNYGQVFSSNVQNITNSPIGNFHSQSYARRSGIKAVCTQQQTLVYQNNSQWLRFTGTIWNSTSHNSGDFDFEFNSSLVTADGTTDSTIEVGFTNFRTSGGGDFGIAIDSNGLDHHSTNYYNLNSSCASQYLYQYGSGYKTNTGLSGWQTSTISCTQDASNQYALLVAIR